MANMRIATLRRVRQRYSYAGTNTRHSEETRNRRQHTIPQRWEEEMLQPDYLVLHTVPTVRHITTLRPNGNLHPILNKLLILNNYPMPLLWNARPQFIRINMDK